MKTLDLYCPLCKEFELLESGGLLLCTNDKCHHSTSLNGFCNKNIPILISEHCDTVCDIEFSEGYISRNKSTVRKLSNLIRGGNKITIQNCKIFMDFFKQKEKPKILIIGSGEKGHGTEDLWKNDKLSITGVDIYKSETVDVVCDAHYLPFKSNFFDGVWIQAVLEHVVDPVVVISELSRVLKNDGLVYSEIPFMQQVHEGAYDFTRYTVSGHRYLYKNFSIIKCGPLGGANTVLSWSMKYFLWALVRNRKIATLLGLLFELILRPFSYLISKKSMYDCSSGTFFLGKKKSKLSTTHKELLSIYEGMM